LYTNGYVAQTFGTRDTPPFFTRLLRVNEYTIQPTVTHEWPGAFFITSPVVPNVRSIYISHINRHAWLLDYELRDYGTVVQQRIWSPGAPADAQRYNNVALNMPIFFVENNRSTLGLPLVHAAAGDCMRLLDAREAALVGNCHTTSIRINVSAFNCIHTEQILTCL
jgi:hypothetical protein